MAHKRRRNINPTRLFRQFSLEKLAISPWIEVILSFILGLIFLVVQKTELAQLTWILGGTLTVTRYALGKKLEVEMGPVHNLASVMDLQRQVRKKRLEELIGVYFAIVEPEFRPIKDNIVNESIRQLEELAQQKKWAFSKVGFYRWLFPMLEGAQPGSKIWAVSMMMKAEWDESKLEDRFLQLNLDAAERRVYIERIFVVPRDEISKLFDIKAIKDQVEHSDEYMTPMLVEREALLSEEPDLLSKLKDGFIAFGERVALVDVNSPSGQIRGYVTMNSEEIHRLEDAFGDLRIHTRPLKDGINTSAGQPVIPTQKAPPSV